MNLRTNTILALMLVTLLTSAPSFARRDVNPLPAAAVPADGDVTDTQPVPWQPGFAMGKRSSPETTSLPESVIVSAPLSTGTTPILLSPAVTNIPHPSPTWFSVLSKKLLSVGDLFDITPENPLFQAWQQVKFSADASLLNKTLQISDSLSAGLSMHYHYTVQPAFIKNEQQRLDQYSVSFGLNEDIVEDFGVGANLSAQISFSRLFEDKVKASTALPYLPSRIPWTSGLALKDLHEGDVVRIELDSSASIGPSDTFFNNGADVAVDVSANINRQGQLVIDIYRMKDNLVRMRIVAVRHQMDLSGAADINPITILNPDAGLILKLIKNNFISIRPLSLGASTNLLNSRPVSTFMVDYVFNLAKEDAAAAFSDTMAQIHHLKLYEFLALHSNKSTVDKNVLALITSPEFLAKRDVNLPAEQRSIDRVFKGTTDTSYFSYFLASKLRLFLQIWNKSISVNSSLAAVRGFDHDDNPVDMLYLSRSSVHNFQAIASKWQTLENDLSEALFKAEASDKKIVPTAMSDIVLTKNLNDKNLSRRQYNRAHSFLELSVPPMVHILPNLDFSKAHNITNGFYRFKLVIHPESFAVMPRLSPTDLYQRLIDLIRRDPFAGEIHISHALVGPVDRDTNKTNTLPEDKLQYDAWNVANKLEVLIDPQSKSSIEEKYKTYLQLHEIELFQELGPALMISLIPSEQLQNMIFLEVSIGGENLKPALITFGQHDASNLYGSFQYMQSLINGRSFDLRLQLNGAGQFQTLQAGVNQVGQNYDGFQTVVK